MRSPKLTYSRSGRGIGKCHKPLAIGGNTSPFRVIADSFFSHDFPEFRDTIQSLKQTDSHFTRLFDQYHEITHEIHGIESNDINVSDAHLDALKLKRVQLKDELYQMMVKSG